VYLKTNLKKKNQRASNRYSYSLAASTRDSPGFLLRGSPSNGGG
jgi:hypothetical protein